MIQTPRTPLITCSLVDSICCFQRSSWSTTASSCFDIVSSFTRVKFLGAMNRFGRAGGLFKIEGQRVLQCSTRVRPYHQLRLTAQLPKRVPAIRPNVSCFRRGQLRWASYEEKAKALNQEGIDQQLNDYDSKISQEKEKQKRAPWHREGSEEPPVRRQRSAGAMTKGKHL